MSLSTMDRLKQTMMLKAFGLLKIPMILFISPKVVDMSATRCEVRIPLNYRTRNHLGSMYFGTLCAGADVAGGLLAMELIKAGGNQVNLVFKDFKAEFLKRADADTHLVSEDGEKVRALVQKAMDTGERVNDTVSIVATCPSKYGQEPVATFQLTISLKKKSRGSRSDSQ